jgi:drug/metabolite transporter (DMT)-like permease
MKIHSPNRTHRAAHLVVMGGVRSDEKSTLTPMSPSIQKVSIENYSLLNAGGDSTSFSLPISLKDEEVEEESPDKNFEFCCCACMNGWWNHSDAGTQKWRRSRLAELVLVIVNVVFGASFVARKDSYDAASPILSLGIMFSFALIPLAPLYARDLRLEYWKHGLFCGTILFISFALQTVGLNETTPQKSAFITALYVKLIPIINFLVTRQRPKVVEIFGLLIALVGTYLLTTGGTSLSFSYGDILTVLCTFGFAGHTVAIDVLSADPNAFASINLGQIFWVTVWSFICAPSFERVHLQPNSANFWIAEAYGGILATGFDFSSVQIMCWSVFLLHHERLIYI